MDQWTKNRITRQKAIDDAYHFLNEDCKIEFDDLVDMVSGLLDICETYAQGFEYPSGQEDEEDE